MSENVSAETIGLDGGDERILLSVDGERDRELLESRLGGRYEVLDGDPASVTEFDLCIVDASTYRRVEDTLADLKSRSAAFLPVLLLVEDRDRAAEAEWLEETVGGSVDDVVVVPTSSAELNARVEALMRARRQSRELALFRRAMDEATIGVSITDPTQPDNPLVYVNEGFSKITGYDQADVVGRNCRFLQGPDTDESTVATIRTAIEAAEPVSVEILNYRADGERFWNLLTIAPVRDAHGEVTHFLGFQRDVTDRVEVTENLRTERELIERIFDTSPVGITMVDAAGTIVRANETAARLLGLERSELTGWAFDDPEWGLVDTDGEPIPSEALPAARAMRSGELVQNAQIGVLVDGDQRWLSVSSAPLTGVDGTVDGAVNTFEDVTERVRRERELERASLVLETMDDGVWALDADRKLTFVNDTILDELPFGERELLGTPVENFQYLFADEDEFERYVDAIDDLFAGRRDDATVDATLSLPGQPMVTNLRLAPIPGDDGVEGVVVVSSDITDRVELESELRSERELLERVFDTSPTGIVLVDADGEIMRANPAAEEALGLERSEVTDRTFDDPKWEAFDETGDPVPSDDFPVARVLRTGERVEDYQHGIRVDGEDRWLSINAAPLTDGEGDIEAVVTGITDITDRVERQRELERYEAIVETTSDPIYVLDPDGHFIRVNDAMVEASGYSRDELLGEHASLVADDETVAESEGHIREILHGDRETAEYEATMVFKDGVRREFAASLAVLVDDGEFLGTVVVAHDITELHQSQRRLSVLDRVLRHNLRNRMNVVLGYARELADHPDDDVAHLGEAIEGSARNLLDLSESARDFEAVIAGGATPSTAMDAVDLVTDTVEHARREHPAADISLDHPDAAPIEANDPFRLAVEEILENAIQHNDRETPTIEVAVRTTDDRVVISVADDGPGIDDLERRALDAGTESPLEHMQGIGLWLVRWSVDSLGGEFDIADNAPRGSVVTITLPLAEA